jgi:mannose-1-phosphate guanylyltransferase
MAKTEDSYIVILAGGGGTRLWPKSRRAQPKQFLRIIDNRTLFQGTVDRVKGTFPLSHIFVATNKEAVSEIRKEAPGLPAENILIEPSSKNTAAAAGLAATYIAKKNPRAIISTLSADHYIKEKEKFLKILSISQKAASRGDYLVTVGIHPTHPHTGLGYIHAGKEVFSIDKKPVFKVNKFKEKPDLATALKYVESGRHFWNANINSYKATTLLKAISDYLPALSEALENIKVGASEAELKKSWEKFPPEPIDTAVLEKAKNVLVLPGEFSWFDVGDWAAIHSILSREPGSNIIIGDESPTHIGVDTQGCLIHGTSKLIATIGLKDLVIIDTADILLICPKDRAQEVKKLVEALAVKKKHQFL